MKRYMLVPAIASTGPMDQYGNHSILDELKSTPNGQGGLLYKISHSSLLKIDNTTGLLLWGFAFSRVATGDQQSNTAVLQISNSLTFPDYPLDGLMSGMDSGARVAWRQSLMAYNLDGQGYHYDPEDDDGESWRDVLERLQNQFEPGLNMNNWDVAEPA